MPLGAPEKSYLTPALEILAFQFLLNRFDNLFIGDEYDVSASSIRKNLRSSWVIDRDPFDINQFGHPYQGSIYYGLARSSGLNFWESFGYTFAGSAVWEIAGETSPPSRNDQITTSFAGTFLGESLFRMASLIRQHSGLASPWRELAASAVSPPSGLNKRLYPDRFRQLLAETRPAVFSRLHVGGSTTRKSSPGNSQSVDDKEAIADFLLDYGLPGKPGYAYNKPWDYFSFQIRSSSARILESAHTRGLILGDRYKIGSRYDGIWGLYGSFDYLAPQLFRLSSTALSLGSTGQWRISDALAVQGTATAGYGFTSTGTIRSTAERDYNYGFAPQIGLALRVLFGNAAVFDVSARKYFAGELANAPGGGEDQVLRADAAFTVRLHRHHAVSLKYVSSRRDTQFPGVEERYQRRDTLGVYYTYLFDGDFGLVH